MLWAGEVAHDGKLGADGVDLAVGVFVKVIDHIGWMVHAAAPKRSLVKPSCSGVCQR